MKYYDKTGREITRDEWAANFNEGYKRIGSATVNFDGVEAFISTVWVGMDMGFGTVEPLIFETMIFADNSDRDEFCQRYATLEDAATTHDRIVKGLRAGVWPEVDQ